MLKIIQNSENKRQISERKKTNPILRKKSQDFEKQNCERKKSQNL